MMSAFGDVDSSADPADCASYLRALASNPAIDAGKRARDALMHLKHGWTPAVAWVVTFVGWRYLVGDQGRAVGLDASEALLERAASRAESSAIEWIAGDAHSLPFADDTFDAARVERMLQHLADPGRAVGELLRAVRPGGTLWICEPDWGTLAISTQPHEAADQARDAMLAHVRHARIGRALAGFLAEAGAREIEISAEAVIFRDATMLSATGVEPDPAYMTRVEQDAANGRLVGLLTLVTAVAHA